MNKRLMAAIMAAGLMCSFTACDFLTGKKPEITTTAEETTTEETTTTVEETTTAEETTTVEETTTSEETATISEESSLETSATKAPTKKPTKAPAKPASVPKGWQKEPYAWGNQEKGYKAYVAYNKKGQPYGWYQGKWVRLYETSKGLHNYEDEEHQYYEALIKFYRDKKHKKFYTSYLSD